MKTHHNKLVRNKIPAIVTANGAVPKTRIIDNDDEYLVELTKKLIEEATEVSETPNIEELADSLEVIYAIGAHLSYTPADIEAARVKKQQARGGFDERIYLVSTSE